MLDNQKTGFSFENCKRNAYLAGSGFKPPKVTKTGTTICGIVFKDGVILGADTRATGGDIVANKNCEKLHYMAANIYCAGAGTAADCDKTTATISSQLELLRLNTGRQVRVVAAQQLVKQMLFRYQGHIGTYLIMGGVDIKGPSLYEIAAHGSTSNVPFCAMGSGTLAAMSVLESGWKKDMEEEDAKKLVRNAIAAGIFNDMGSGSNVDLVVIKANDNVQYLRAYDEANVKGTRRQKYTFKKGTTEILTESVRNITLADKTTFTVTSTDVRQVEQMDSA
ncbi:proteasome subunit beta type-7 [Eurytemora carolleeae]|uniref:proteasome subunit beta type-7 n=1 Tax=Eurytemora carolleeae TaxID=1294199 RepID=UPI000C761393|nr:proteasome subunit beta type-7 [Eurytemora carolleeae]|eukprot:XP_023334946.1 proteasome subunit beta type-7-like [Eurytemora affinis]